LAVEGLAHAELDLGVAAHEVAVFVFEDVGEALANLAARAPIDEALEETLEVLGVAGLEDEGFVIDVIEEGAGAFGGAPTRDHDGVEVRVFALEAGDDHFAGDVGQLIFTDQQIDGGLSGEIEGFTAGKDLANDDIDGFAKLLKDATDVGIGVDDE